jgi:sulfur carrier protein
MTVFVNSNPVTLTTVATLQYILEQQHLHEQRGIAVAVNNNVIPKTEWQQKALNDNDKITIIKATQGG